MTQIITVHGTNAGEDSDSGEQWWQLGSYFQKKLREYVEAPDGRLVFTPFHWGKGPNSELHRRDAGNDLRRLLLTLEEKNEPYSVIGHSHGGSVLTHTLFSIYAKKLNLPNMKSWITVATPFIQTERTGFYFGQFNTFGKIGLLIAFTALFTGLVQFLSAYEAYRNLEAPLFDIVNISLWFFGIFLGGFIVFLSRLFTIRSEKRRNAKHQLRFNNAFSLKWMGFYHSKDEAIRGLQNLKSVSTRLFSYSSMSKGFAALSALVAVILWSIAYSSCIVGVSLVDQDQNSGLCKFYDATHLSNFYAPLLHPLEDFAGNGDWQLVLTNVAFTLAAYLEALVFAGLFWVAGRAAGIVIFFPLAAAINNLVTSRIKNTGYGADSFGEGVAAVDHKPGRFFRNMQSLPAELEQEIEDFTENYAIDAIRKIRTVISSNLGTSDDPITDQISDTLSWKELIHTAYFDVDNFIKLVAVSLCESNLTRPSEKLLGDPDYDKVCGWYQDLLLDQT